jgi:hypothetical protein|tara:strand:- start:230 stop:886 length:657 start_codon:yes stop_codon:yes gene_type:complete
MTEADKKQQLSYNIYQPFGPSILKTKLPNSYVEAINTEADRILASEDLSKEYDFSHNLAGNVKKEISIDEKKIQGLKEFYVAMAQEYVKKILLEAVPPNTQATFSTWVVSQFAGDFNPIHIHDSTLSGVAFLKVPEKFEEEYSKEDHHATAGCLEFLGSLPNHFVRHSYLAKPQVGDFYLFPSWLAHQVYPFRSEGERRSMAFNIHLKTAQPVKGLNT